MSDAKRSILIVDDDDAIRALLRTILQRRGLAADSARDGNEALECLARSRYAVMLLDLMMPRESGWDVLGEIARWPLNRRPIIIVLTAGPEPRTLDPTLVASPGGWPLIEGGKLIGAIGCSGGTGDQDAAACKAGADLVK